MPSLATHGKISLGDSTSESSFHVKGGGVDAAIPMMGWDAGTVQLDGSQGRLECCRGAAAASYHRVSRLWELCSKLISIPWEQKGREVAKWGRRSQALPP